MPRFNVAKVSVVSSDVHSISMLAVKRLTKVVREHGDERPRVSSQVLGDGAEGRDALFDNL